MSAGMLDGKTTIVTGGAQGIGRASCLLFAKEGAKVVVGDVIEAGGRETEKIIRDSGDEAALWLLSDRSSFTTGHMIMVDGGLPRV